MADGADHRHDGKGTERGMASSRKRPVQRLPLKRRGGSTKAVSPIFVAPTMNACAEISISFALSFLKGHARTQKGKKIRASRNIPPHTGAIIPCSWLNARGTPIARHLLSLLHTPLDPLADSQKFRRGERLSWHQAPLCHSLLLSLLLDRLTSPVLCDRWYNPSLSAKRRAYHTQWAFFLLRLLSHCTQYSARCTQSQVHIMHKVKCLYSPNFVHVANRLFTKLGV